ncbi:MAG: hypothetical protein B7W98_00495 [Parcubacteria group bacterium 20-58-5]|nr:MAG: hypothetical protein B7W98_00495 [Parcubacteria group bacterium 20-58-5]OYV63498.1 MAG: hypothetical protein B7X03_01630 [Parcubacteria group bacterium 21-58-10]
MYRKLSGPVSCQIEVTTGCNHNCIHCYNYWRHESSIQGANLSESILDKVISDLIEMRVFHVTFTGGEPLLRWEILKKGISTLMAAGVVCDVNTNLTLMTPSIAGQLKGLGVGGVLTSVMASDAALHDHIAQAPGAFNATLRGIATAQDAGLVVAASVVVTKLNIDEVYATGEFLKSIGVTQFYATKASPPINSREFEQYMLDHDELLRLLDQLHKLHDNQGISVGALECYPLCSYLNQDKYSFMSDRRCSAGVTTCSIGADGTVRACSHDDVVYGNVMIDGLSAAWDAMQNWRDGSFIPSECKKCAAFAQCSAGCRVDAMYMSGCKSNLDPYAQPDQARQIIPRPVKQVVNLADASLSVSRQLKFRDEGFCVLCASPKKIASPSTLSQASYGLIQSLQALGASFGLADVMEYTKLPVKDANALSNAFLDDGIFQLLSR